MSLSKSIAPAHELDAGPSALRLVSFAVADGANNMAADEVMLRTAAAHDRASLRFYAWHPATASLGYFQKASDRVLEPSVAALPWVRRATGGATLVHDHELTYALALPRGTIWQADGAWMPRMHRIIAKALAKSGVPAALTLVEKPELRGGLLCFEQHTPGDLICRGSKIVGSAQRKWRQCLLQHGGVLLAQSCHAPKLPGLLELAGVHLSAVKIADAIVAELQRETGWPIEKRDWTAEELCDIEQTAGQKFRAAAWNEKR